MTYQQPSPTHDDDNDDADEASSLLLPVAGGEVPSTKKKHGLPLRAVVATCVLLGTLAVLSSPLRRGSNRHNDTHLTVGIAAALLLDHNQAATPVYNPTQDFCYHDTDNPSKFCWWYVDCLPAGNWKGEGGHGSGNCGKQCTKFADVQNCQFL